MNDQTDSDADGIGDACDGTPILDTDSDGVLQSRLITVILILTQTRLTPM